jgi:hypothetical protein
MQWTNCWALRAVTKELQAATLVGASRSWFMLEICGPLPQSHWCDRISNFGRWSPVTGFPPDGFFPFASCTPFRLTQALLCAVPSTRRAAPWCLAAGGAVHDAPVNALHVEPSPALEPEPWDRTWSSEREQGAQPGRIGLPIGEGARCVWCKPHPNPLRTVCFRWWPTVA